jgi:hypothetical protein
MSYQTNRNWYYYLNGRDLQLYQLSNSGNVTVVAGKRVRLPESPYGNYLVYPDEDITDGLRIEYTHLGEPFISESMEDTNVKASGTGISFDPGPAATISDTDDGFSDFAQGDKIRVIGSASNDGDYTLTPSGTVDEDTLTITGTFTTEAVGESITIYQIPKAVTTTSADESSHVNLNRMLSLAVVDYLQAKVAELSGNLPLKDYHMRDFWKKVGDNDSNKRKIAMSFSMSPFAIR